MGKLDFIYFCMYNRLYKDGFGLQEKTSYKALSIESRPVFLFALISWFLSTAARYIVKFIAHPAVQLFYENYEMLIPVAFYFLYFLMFVYNDRYTIIYAKYWKTDKAVQKRMVNGIFIVLGLSVFPLLIYVFTKP